MRKILVVDDNVVSRELMRYVLKPTGYEVLEAAAGVEALQVIADARPDVVLLDLEMPGLDGYAVLRSVREDPECQGLIVVALTAYAMQSDRERAMAAGFDGYVTKPIDGTELRKYLQELLAS